MKRFFLVTALIFAISLGASARKLISEGKTYTAFGAYKIELSDNPVILMGKEMKAFIISYENTNLEVTVVFDKGRKDMTYYVLSPNLAIKYVCNGQYFGVQKLTTELEKDGYKTSDSALNRSEYFHQKVLKTGGGCDLDNSRLIAAFFPMLINNYENILASK
jgi:hypothetical protein